MGLVREAGGKFHPKLNMFLRLIANKYHKGKVKKDFDKINKQCLNLLKRN